jgi:hypothetical protein
MAIGDYSNRAITLRIHARADGHLQVRNGDLMLGTSHNEMLAVRTAVMAADELAKLGNTVRVVRNAAGRDIEEYIARARRPS